MYKARNGFTLKSAETAQGGTIKSAEDIITALLAFPYFGVKPASRMTSVLGLIKSTALSFCFRALSFVAFGIFAISSLPDSCHRHFMGGVRPGHDRAQGIRRH